MSFKPKMQATMAYYEAMPPEKLRAKIGNMEALQRQLAHCMAAAKRVQKDKKAATLPKTARAKPCRTHSPSWKTP